MTKILVIDDERSIRNSMKDILQYEGHEVVLAENGMEGLVSVKSEKPDIVFCDIKMPKMEGIEVLERIKEFSADTPVIMISGHGIIDTAIAEESLRRMDIDFLGLDALDRNMMRTIITVFNGGPVGIDTLAATIGEEGVTLEDVCEPYLMQLGFLSRTPKGRMVTDLAYKHLNIKNPKAQNDIVQQSFDEIDE